MLNNRIKSKKNHNYDLVLSYLENYEKIDQLYGAYKNYSSLMLCWADSRDLLQAPKYRSAFADFIEEKGKQNGRQYSSNYIYSACLYARDFFRYCKAVLPEEDTESITDFWLKNMVPSRESAQRLSFDFLTDDNLKSIMNLKAEQRRLKRAQAAVLLTSVTGLSRGALLSVPIKGIDFDRLLVYQYPELGVYTEKLASGTTHIFPECEIIEFLKKYTEEIKKEVPDESTWYVRFSRHGQPQPVRFESITSENQKDVYSLVTAPYGKLKEDLAKIGELCRIPKITMTIAQNTYIFKRLRCDSTPDSVNKITQDLLFRNTRPVKQCLKFLNNQ